MITRARNREAATGRFLGLPAKGPPGMLETALAKVGIRLLQKYKGEGEEIDVRRLPPNTALAFEPFRVVLLNADLERIEGAGIFESVEEEQFVSLPTPPNTEIADATCTGQYDHSVVAWGLQVTRCVAANNQGLTGKGCRVCVIDSGLHLAHPDFATSVEAKESFIGGTAQDEFGHGTHCAGIICGNRKTPGPRYSVAPDARLLVARVFKDFELAPEAVIIAAIQWAVANRAHVISISIQKRVAIGEGYSLAIEDMAKDALVNHKTLIVGIAGNYSLRGVFPPNLNPVAHPANCPSIMAVGGLGTCLNVANVSNSSLNGGQKVDIAAPGVFIDSAFIPPDLYKTSSGTSTAAPIVAGIAALHFEQTGKTGAALWQAVIDRHHDLQLPMPDVGVGMALAPKP